MSPEPTLPADAAPGPAAEPLISEPPATENASPESVPAEAAALPSPHPNAIQAAAELARSRRWQAAAGVAIGVGSAAVAAALLYANRPKRD